MTEEELTNFGTGVRFIMDIYELTPEELGRLTGSTDQLEVLHKLMHDKTLAARLPLIKRQEVIEEFIASCALAIRKKKAHMNERIQKRLADHLEDAINTDIRRTHEKGD